MTDKEYENWLTTEKSRDALNARELEMYRSHRRNIIEWMLEQGKTPEAYVGYSKKTVKQRSYRLDKFYRWVWEVEQGYTENIKPMHANAFVKHLLPLDYSDSHKAAHQKALFALFKWQRYDLGRNVEWDPEIQFNEPRGRSSRDALSKDERTKLREASLSIRSIPSYHSLTPDERDDWKGYVAQYLGKEKSEVAKKDFQKVNGWKWPSLIWTSLDAGLRPIEVGKAKVSWVDTRSGLLRIPAEDAVKNKMQWDVGLRERTVSILEDWIEERERYEKYDDSDRLWLTRYGNGYGSKSLNRWFRKLCDEAGIHRPDRNLSWYSIRHSVGREMMKEMGIGGAAAQLRHKSMQSTLRYVRPSAKERQDALDDMG